MVVTGEQGTGKTTLALFVANHLLSGAAGTSAFPLFVHLPAVQDLGAEGGLLRYLTHEYGLSKADVEALKSWPSVVVLLDGMDELTTKVPDRLVEFNGLDQWENLKVVMFCRSDHPSYELVDITAWPGQPQQRAHIGFFGQEHIKTYVAKTTPEASRTAVLNV
eukprot:gene3482-3945_t